MVHMNRDIAENITKHIAENISQIQNNGFDIEQKELDHFIDMKLQVKIDDTIDFLGGFQIRKENVEYVIILAKKWNNKSFYNMAVFRKKKRKMEISTIKNGVLCFEYVPRRQDGNNPFRKQYFQKIYPNRFIDLPISENDPEIFIDKLCTLTENRCTADAQTPESPKK